MKIIFSILLCLLSVVSFSQQKFFASMPPAKSNLAMATSGVFGTTGWFFRPIVSVVSYSVPGNEVSAGAGAAYEFMSFDPSTNAWTSLISFSALVYYNQSLTGYKPYPIGIGGAIGLFDNHVLVGAKYDGRNPQLEIGTGISFN